MNTTRASVRLTLSHALWRQVKAQAALAGLTVREWVEDRLWEAVTTKGGLSHGLEKPRPS